MLVFIQPTTVDNEPIFLAIVTKKSPEGNFYSVFAYLLYKRLKVYSGLKAAASCI